jgi:hypothetical protein
LSHEKPTEEIRELAALFSLGALTQHEASSFEAHVREGCPVCEAEYYRFKHITAEIGLAANEAAAPDYIRELILARIERESLKEKPKVEPEKEESAVRIPPSPAPRPILTQPVAKRSGVFPWMLAAILAIAAGLSFYFYHSEQAANDQLKVEMATARSDIKDLEILLDIQKGRRGELEQIISTVSKPETRILHLAGYERAPSTSGAILWDAPQNKCLIFGYMPPPPQGKTYQLWYITPTAKIPSGFPKPDPAGRIFDWFPIPEDITSLTMVISLEPEGGAQIPSLPYIAIGRKD